MMGTAAGAQKARERLQARLRATAATAESNSGQAADQLIDIDDQIHQADRANLTVEVTAAVNQQLKAASLDSITLLRRIVRGQTRAPMQTRANVAIRLMEFNGHGQPASKQPAPSDVSQLAILERIGAALGVRKPVTVDVKPGAIREEPVEAVATAVTPTE